MALGLSRGKTSLCKYLANSFIREGLTGGYLDSDLGQQIMYVPTTLNIGPIKKPIISGKDIEPEFTRFIGATFPKETLKFTVSHECNNLIQDYVEDHPETDFIIIDTDGWIKSEAGLIYKLFFIKTVDPDFVVAFHDEDIDELKEIEKKVKESKARELYKMEKENQYYYDKDKEDRRFLRQSRFSNILETFQKTSIQLDDIKFVKKEYDKENNEVIEKELELKELIQLPYHYVLIALLDDESNIINLGLLFSINLEKDYFLAFTDLKYKEQIKIKKVQVGSLRLSTKGNHQGYLYL
jgi:polynucleotide 5'-kinase involved in rRNA processing